MKSDNHFGIFDDIFHLSARFANDTIKYLLGLNDSSKKALMLFSALQIEIKGFVVTAEQDNFVGISYLNHPVISIADIDDTCIVINVFGKHIDVNIPNMQILFESDDDSILLYGGGQSGQAFMEFAESVGLHVTDIYDKQAKILANKPGVHSIKSPHDIEVEPRDRQVVVAIKDQATCQSVQEWLRELGFERVSYFNDTLFHYDLYEKRFGVDACVFRACMIRYMEKTAQRRKPLYFYSKDVQHLCNVIKRLRYFGVFGQGVTDVDFDINVLQQKFPTVEVKNIQYLLQDKDEYYIWVLGSDEDAGRELMNNSGLLPDCFIYSVYSPNHLLRRNALDVHLGIIDARGSIIRRNYSEGQPEIKIGILGGSTSDYDYLLEKSWPYYLLNLAREQGIRIECVVAATASHNSSQELIRLIRDVIWEQPDIVISYSRINEVTNTVSHHRYAHPYQDRLFKAICTHNPKPIVGISTGKYYLGRDNDCSEDVWIMNEKMMHAICCELGIKFFAVLQPYPFEISTPSRSAMELREHRPDWSDEYVALYRRITFKAREILGQEYWFIDFTDIFDADNDEVYIDVCHLLQEKNKVLAEKMFALITGKA